MKYDFNGRINPSLFIGRAILLNAVWLNPNVKGFATLKEQIGSQSLVNKQNINFEVVLLKSFKYDELRH